MADKLSMTTQNVAGYGTSLCMPCMGEKLHYPARSRVRVRAMSEYEYVHTHRVNKVPRGNGISTITVNRPKRYAGALPKYDWDTYSISITGLRSYSYLNSSDRNIQPDPIYDNNWCFSNLVRSSC